MRISIIAHRHGYRFVQLFLQIKGRDVMIIAVDGRSSCAFNLAARLRRAGYQAVVVMTGTDALRRSGFPGYDALVYVEENPERRKISWQVRTNVRFGHPRPARGTSFNPEGLYASVVDVFTEGTAAKRDAERAAAASILREMFYFQ